MKHIVCVVAVAALELSCGRLDCSPRTVTLTGNVEKDILGSWDGFGIDSRVVLTFFADGGVSQVEEPNQFAPNGLSGRSSYQVVDGGIVRDASRYTASFTTTSLTLTEVSATAEFTREHAALTCRGQAFE